MYFNRQMVSIVCLIDLDNCQIFDSCQNLVLTDENRVMKPISANRILYQSILKTKPGYHKIIKISQKYRNFKPILTAVKLTPISEAAVRKLWAIRKNSNKCHCL